MVQVEYCLYISKNSARRQEIVTKAMFVNRDVKRVEDALDPFVFTRSAVSHDRKAG